MRNTDDAKNLRTLNKIEERLMWCREILGLSQADVVRETKIPKSSYSNRECGIRSINFEEYEVIADYFNRLWQEKFKKDVPSFRGSKIYKIKFVWIMLGKDE